MSEKFKDYLFADIMAVILVTIMVFAAEYTGEKEIIFPEMAALSVGYLVSLKRSWMVNGRRMLALITGCAVLGVLIVRYVNIGDYFEFLLAFVISQILFMYSGTTFAPFISAIVLPVVLQTTSFIYPIAAFLLTLILILGHKLLIGIGKRADESYSLVYLNSRGDVIDMIKRLVIAAVVAGVAFYLGFKFVIAPPLLVAFTEFTRLGNKAKEKPVKAVMLVTVCGIIGAFLRYIIVMKLGLPMTLAAAVIMTMALLVIHAFKMYMPPAGAIAVLALLIPECAVITFPLQIFTGIALFMISARIFFHRTK